MKRIMLESISVPPYGIWSQCTTRTKKDADRSRIAQHLIDGCGGLNENGPAYVSYVGIPGPQLVGLFGKY